MDRFELLLRDFYESNNNKAGTGTGGVIYDDYVTWARAQAKLRKGRLEALDNDYFDYEGNEAEHVAGGVYKPKGTNVVKVWNAVKPKKAGGAKKKGGDVRLDIWKTAVYGTPKSFEFGTDVLCLLDAEKSEASSSSSSSSSSKALDHGGQAWYSAVVVAKVDGCVRIHFSGMRKDEDRWMTLGSRGDPIFLDMGIFKMDNKAMRSFGMLSDGESKKKKNKKKEEELEVEEEGGRRTRGKGQKRHREDEAYIGSVSPNYGNGSPTMKTRGAAGKKKISQA